MNIVVRKTNGKAPVSARHLNQPSPYDKRYGAWGHVADTDDDEKAAYSGDNSVDVVLDMGVCLRHIPVASFEWVVNKAVSGKGCTTGERDLPPPNARVFIMMPTGTFDDCFVLCSGFSPVEKNDNAPFSDGETEKIRERIKQGGWHTIYDCAAGSYEAISPDEKTCIKIDYGDGEEEKEHPELRLKLFDKTTLDIIDEESANLSVFDGEVKVEHKKGDNAKITVFDTEFSIKQGEVTMRPKKTTVEVDGDLSFKTNGEGKFMAETGSLEIGNSIGALGAMIAEFIDGVSNAVTAGSPAAHTMNPATKIALSTLKAKWNRVFS
ncbi:MAG: hypothetical protein LBK73_03520 [Treponema sp.]|jgi:hypothetical protein|nr:hypothetical protein [Treponema sp.]